MTAPAPIEVDKGVQGTQRRGEGVREGVGDICSQAGVNIQPWPSLVSPLSPAFMGGQEGEVSGLAVQACRWVGAWGTPADETSGNEHRAVVTISHVF